MQNQQRVVHRADLRAIENNLSNIHSGIEHMYHYVQSVQHKVQETDAKLDKLSKDFYTYLQEEVYARHLQLAETRLVRVRQKLDKDFGHYDAIRRRATGIMQAIDVGIVRDEVISNTTENLMLNAPKYWLAPCLVALSAWASDKKELAEKALREGFKRNDQKTSLFFALVTRRYERLEASTHWLENYFYLQDVNALDREVIVLLDSFTNGVFTPQARKRCMSQMNEWMKDVMATHDHAHKVFIDPLEQFIIPRDISQDYPYMQKNVSTFETCQKSLEFAYSHQMILEFLHSVFGGEVQPLQRLHDAVDQMLVNLVTDFDPEELPLRQDDRFLNLIIEENGNRVIAENKFGLEKSAWNQKFHFKDVMKILGFFPQTVQATKATQRFALAFCKDWLVQAYKDFTANHRKEFPTEVEIKIGDWTGKTRDGRNQKELVTSLLQSLGKKQTGKGKIQFEKIHYIAVAVGGLLSILGFSLSFLHIGFIVLGLLGLIGPVWYLWVRRQNKKAKRMFIEQEKEEAKNTLLASIAEIVDWRREYMKADEEASNVKDFIATIDKNQYVQSGLDQARAVQT